MEGMKKGAGTITGEWWYFVDITSRWSGDIEEARTRADSLSRRSSTCCPEALVRVELLIRGTWTPCTWSLLSSVTQLNTIFRNWWLRFTS